MCGEKLQQRLNVVVKQGSPPRVRGKDGHIDAVQHLAGITPACAGKSEQDDLLQRLPGDHPRVCGEKAFASAWALIRAGSPPRVRGKEVFRLLLHQRFGITPACAGKSFRHVQDRRGY